MTRLIEVGGADNPIVPTRTDTYVGIDPLYIEGSGTLTRAGQLVEASGVTSSEFIAKKVQDLEPELVEPTQLVVMQNVLGNMLSASARLAVVKAALSLVCEDGRLVVVENITPEQAGLKALETVLSDEGLWVGVFGRNEPTFSGMLTLLDLQREPARLDKILIARPKS